MRPPLAVTVHAERHDDAELAAVAAYDRRRAARYQIPREQQRAPEIFGYAPFYGWPEDKTRQAAEPEGRRFPGICAPAASPLINSAITASTVAQQHILGRPKIC